MKPVHWAAFGKGLFSGKAVVGWERAMPPRDSTRMGRERHSMEPRGGG